MTSNISALKAQLKAARTRVKMSDFGSDAFDEAMVVVRDLVEQIQAAQPVEEYCSIDSGGIYRTRLLSGRIV